MSYILMCRGFLGIKCLNFLNKAVPLFIIEHFPFKCMPKFNLGSNTRPRCLWDSERLTSFQLKWERENDLGLFPWE